MDARCNGNAKFDCKQNDSKTFRINFDQRWWCCRCCYVKHQKWKTENPTHINSIKNLVFSTEINSSTVIIWFIYFIKSFPFTEFPPYSLFALHCVARFIGSICSLIINNGNNKILGNHNKKREDNSKLDSMQVRRAFFKVQLAFLNWIIICIHALWWRLRTDLFEIVRIEFSLSLCIPYAEYSDVVQFLKYLL